MFFIDLNKERIAEKQSFLCYRILLNYRHLELHSFKETIAFEKRLKPFFMKKNY